ncbi:MAG TPA: glutamine amidotransferase [Actinobacteria bacterium]|nr:glutamine amidotransferase [Actinomycetota bacterium]
MTVPVVLAHLYPRRMNIYGDIGNLLALRRRLEWRDLPVRVVTIDEGDRFDFEEADVVVAGGGEDASQLAIASDLVERGPAIHRAVAAGVAFLTVCGTYQLFGRRFVTADGSEIPGIGVFGAETFGGGTRMIGNVVVHSPWGDLVGFENHSGRTRLDPDQQSLGKVRRGNGNDGESGQEGAITRNCLGTYLHGSVLPKNPALADDLIRRALARRGAAPQALASLDDTMERQAAAAAAERP